MNRLRNLRSKLPSSPSSSSLPGAKLSKAFKFNKEHKVLPTSESRWGANPFNEGPQLEEPSLPRIHLILHGVAIFFTFLAICTMGAVASFQAKWFAVSGGTAFSLFLLIFAIILNIILLVIPTVYDRWDKLKSANGFLAAARTRLIIHAFGGLLTLLAAFVVTVSAWTAKGCKNADNDPHSDLGDDFKNGLSQWCQTKKASGIFDWFSFTAWLVLLVLTIIEWRREMNEDPPFTPPDTGISSSNVHERLAARQRDDEEATLAEDPYAEKETLKTGAGAALQKTGYESYGYSRAQNDADDVEGSAFGRPSIDAYGAFDGDMPGGRAGANASTMGGTTLGRGSISRLDSGTVGAAGAGDGKSRTMQLAYNDPYDQIRQSLLGGPSNPYAPIQAQSQAQAHEYQTVQTVHAVQPVQSPYQEHSIQQVYPVQPQQYSSPPASHVSSVQHQQPMYGSPGQQQPYGRGTLPQPPVYSSPQQGYGGY